MKRNEVGDFTVLYVEPGDQRADLFQTIGIQKKPVVIILASQAGVLQRPDDFTLLKYVKRQTGLPIIFILAHGGQQAQLAARNGFPVYQSMDALLDALNIGQIARMRTANASDTSNTSNATYIARTTKPLFTDEDSQEVQLYGQMNIPSPSPLSRPSAALTPSSSSVTGPDDEQAEPKQEAQRISQPLTPIPQSLMPEGDTEQQKMYPDPYRRLTADIQASVQYNPASIWLGTDINLTDRNTGPLTPRNVGEVGQEERIEASPISTVPAPPTESLAPRKSGEVQRIGTSPIPTLPAPTRELPDIDIEEEQVQDQPTHPLPNQKTPGWVEEPVPTTPVIPEWPRPSDKTNQTNPRIRFAKTRQARLLGKGKARFYILMCVLIIAATCTFLVLPHVLNGGAATAQVYGHMVFTSSGQVSETSSQGIEDQVTLDLTNLSAPASGKALYAWLLGDKKQNDPRTILLGKLQVNNGNAHLFYPGDAQHSNMLLITSRMLVTEEDATITPIAPSPDQNTWRYYNEFSTTPINAPDNTKHFSFLDHLRHLLAADPTLEELELPGGLNNWLYNNTSKVKEWVDSTRQQWEETKDTTFVRRQLERSLQFLDGDTFVYQDIPQGNTLLVNERLARIGLINITGPNQAPPDYLDHISHHLNGLLEANPTPATRQQIAALITALANVNQWLQQVRRDAKQLMAMTDDQMVQQSTLSVINNMIANMDNAYSGQLDPSTNTMHEGVDWLHKQMQFLATLDITHWNGTSVIYSPNRNDSKLSQPRGLISDDKGVKI